MHAGAVTPEKLALTAAGWHTPVYVCVRACALCVYMCVGVHLGQLPKVADGATPVCGCLCARAAAASVAECVTYPVDATKTRLQLQGEVICCL
jgi:hypothetical protein